MLIVKLVLKKYFRFRSRLRNFLASTLTLPTTNYPQQSNKGFTLIELTVAVFGFSLIVVGIVALVSNILRTSTQQGGLLADTDQARRVGFGIMSELRNAVNSSNGAYPLDTAGDQQIIFYTNVDGGTDIERVRYYIQNTNLYKGIIKPSGSPLVYSSSNEVVTLVQRNVANGAAPLFYYYASNFDGTTNSFLAQPVNVTQVTFVKMNLVVSNKAGVINAHTYTITASAAMRSLKTNLGQ